MELAVGHPVLLPVVAERFCFDLFVAVTLVGWRTGKRQKSLAQTAQILIF